MSTDKFVIVESEYGPVKGTRKSTVLGLDYINFQGIPYMKAPVGKLRFRDAQPPEKWSEPLDASREVAFVAPDMMTMKMTGEEDAGVVNVYTKHICSKKKLPVMFWIHGGGFQTGSAKTDMYGPDYLLQKDVVIVSINYRMNAFGFLSLDDPSLGVPGNAGLKDQTFALKWVQRNIEHFGGDPNNVTIFGESAGGASVHYHMVSELSKGLFHRAIAMSGVVFNTTFALQPRRNNVQRLVTAMGYEGSQEERDMLEFLESAEPYKIAEFCDKVLTNEEKHGEMTMLPFGPQIEPYQSDNCFIPKHPMLMARDAWSRDIDFVLGGTSNEGLLMAFAINLMGTDAPVTALQNSANFAPLLELELAPGDAKAIEYGKILKQAYYGFTIPSKTNLEGYFYYSTDYLFWHGIYRTVLSRVATGGQGKTFLYRFDVVTGLNFLKKLAKVEEYPGAEHAADIFHIFKGTIQPAPSIESVEFENVKKTVGIFTNFAITGNVNSSYIGNAEWEPVTSTQLPLKCLNIENEKCEFIELPETERMNLWDSIYEKAGVELY